jgi:hypothetical protein
MWDTFACASAIFLSHFIISIAVLENVPPDAGLHIRATFSTLNVGLSQRENGDLLSMCGCSNYVKHFANVPICLCLFVLYLLLLRRQKESIWRPFSRRRLSLLIGLFPFSRKRRVSFSAATRPRLFHKGRLFHGGKDHSIYIYK